MKWFVNCTLGVLIGLYAIRSVQQTSTNETSHTLDKINFSTEQVVSLLIDQISAEEIGQNLKLVLNDKYTHKFFN
jgi:hypothetical protein